MSYLHFKNRTQLGPNQKKIMKILKQEKEMKIIDIGRRLGKKNNQMQSIHCSCIYLEQDGLIEIKGVHPKIAIYKKDFVPADEPKPKQKLPRKIVKVEEIENLIKQYDAAVIPIKKLRALYNQ